MENSIPEFWEREWKIAFPTFGNGNGNEKLIPKLWEREWEAGIPGNVWERKFPGMFGNGNSRSPLQQMKNYFGRGGWVRLTKLNNVHFLSYFYLAPSPNSLIWFW